MGFWCLYDTTKEWSIHLVCVCVLLLSGNTSGPKTQSLQNVQHHKGNEQGIAHYLTHHTFWLPLYVTVCPPSFLSPSRPPYHCLCDEEPGLEEAISPAVESLHDDGVQQTFIGGRPVSPQGNDTTLYFSSV